MSVFLAILLFASELLLWFGVGRFTYGLVPLSPTLKLIVGGLAALAIIFLWGMFFSPRGAYRLPKLPRTIFIVLLCLGFGYGLYMQGDKNLGLLLMIGASIIQVLGQYLIHKD